MELRTQEAKAAETHDVRGEIRDDDEAVHLMDHPDSDEEIPTLDIAAYLNGQPGGREAAAAKLREISKTVGFFYLKGHGIPQELIDRRVRTVAAVSRSADRDEEQDSLFRDRQLQVGLPALHQGRLSAHQHQHHRERETKSGRQVFRSIARAAPAG